MPFINNMDCDADSWQSLIIPRKTLAEDFMHAFPPLRKARGLRSDTMFFFVRSRAHQEVQKQDACGMEAIRKHQEQVP